MSLLKRTRCFMSPFVWRKKIQRGIILWLLKIKITNQPVSFKMTRLTPTQLVFANPRHDFPFHHFLYANNTRFHGGRNIWQDKRKRTVTTILHETIQLIFLLL